MPVTELPAEVIPPALEPNDSGRPLRILMMSNKCPPDYDGGFELRSFQIAQALRARGHHVDLVTSRYRDTFAGPREDPEWVHRIFRFVPVSRSQTLWRKVDRVLKHLEGTNVAAENVPAMEEFLRGREYDVAYGFGLLRVSFAVSLPVSARGIPILWHAGSSCIADHFHGWPRDIPGYRLGMNLFAGKWYRREQQSDFRHVAYVSNFLRDRARATGFQPQGEYVISRGISFAAHRDVERERATPPRFLLACRIDEQKGVHHALTAAALLLQKRPELPWQMELAGASVLPGYRALLEKQIARDGLGERVRFLGQLPHAEVMARLRSATAFLFTSINGEPFSSTIIEALACGTPLIGSDDGSILEVVEPGNSALVYPRHEPAQLAAHLERILDDPALRLSLARAGLEVIAQRYTLDRILDQTVSTLRQVMRGHTPHHPALSLSEL